MPKTSKQRRPRNRAGLLPEQYRRRATVYIERPRGADEPKRYGEDDLYTTDGYIVVTTRTSGQWTHVVERRGEVTNLPGKVVDRINSQRAAIVEEQRKDRAQAASERMRGQPFGKRAQADVEAAMEQAEIQ